MAVIIGRPINGVSINGNEYVKDDHGNMMKFKDEREARAFLHEHGMSDVNIELQGIVFEDYLAWSAKYVTKSGARPSKEG